MSGGGGGENFRERDLFSRGRRLFGAFRYIQISISYSDIFIIVYHYLIGNTNVASNNYIM